MNIKSVSAICTILALAACGDTAQDPAKLRGGNFATRAGDMEITLSFAPEDMRVNGRALNIYNASYTADGNKIKFGDMLSTMMAGPEEEMIAEQEYFHFMSTVETYQLTQDNTLILRNGDGTEIVFYSTDVQTTSDATDTDSEPSAPETTDSGTADAPTDSGTEQ